MEQPGNQINPLLRRLAVALEMRNPCVARALRPGIARAKIQERLDRHQVKGNIDAILQMFEWHDGISCDPTSNLRQMSLFPDSVYMFMDLSMALDHRFELSTTLVLHEDGEQAARQLFPIFWDNSTGYIMVDLNSPVNRTLLLDPESVELVHEAYDTFKGFLEAVVSANEQNEGLSCFQD